MYDPRDDAKLSIICQNIVENVPAKCIFVCGSRATGYGIGKSSDYDVGVVMSTLAVPFYLRRLKRLERQLEDELNAVLVINPLPTFRLHRARGNLFLYKLKLEAITLYGDKISELLGELKVEDIGTYWHLSYFFSALKELLHDFSPSFLNIAPDRALSVKLARSTTKALLYCGQIHLLNHGQYATRPMDILSKLREMNLPMVNREELLKDTELASQLYENKVEEIPQLLPFWCRVRNYLLGTFGVLVDAERFNASTEIKQLAVEYSLSSDRGGVLKNLQYLVMVMLVKKKICWRSLFTFDSVEKRVWMALLWLLLAVDRTSNHQDNECLLRAYHSVKGYVDIGYSEDAVTLWENLKKGIMEYYPCACTLIGF